MLWNNFYEYELSYADRFDFFLCSTGEQRDLLERHLQETYPGRRLPLVATLPVGSLPELSLPAGERIPGAVLTCSRLAPEKHVDLLVRAVALARERVPQIRLDIYGTGPEEKQIREAIGECGAEGYVKLLGHRELSGVYERYSAYASASTSEGFGLTLMEAVGSGLPLVGFDVPYGNRAFIEDGGNGYLVPLPEEGEPEGMVVALGEALVRLFTVMDLSAASARSYEIAEGYLTQRVAEGWRDLLEGGKR